jgi:hypothetical protein
MKEQSSEELDSELTPVELKEVPSDVPGFLRREGEYQNSDGQLFLLVAGAQEAHEEALREFASDLRVWYQAIPVEREGGEVVQAEEIHSRMEDSERQRVREEGGGADEAQFVTFEANLRNASGTFAVVCRIDPSISRSRYHGYAGPEFVTVSSTGAVRLGGVARGPVAVPPARRQRYANNYCWIYGVQDSRYEISHGWYRTW